MPEFSARACLPYCVDMKRERVLFTRTRVRQIFDRVLQRRRSCSTGPTEPPPAACLLRAVRAPVRTAAAPRPAAGVHLLTRPHRLHPAGARAGGPRASNCASEPDILTPDRAISNNAEFRCCCSLPGYPRQPDAGGCVNGDCHARWVRRRVHQIAQPIQCSPAGCCPNAAPGKSRGVHAARHARAWALSRHRTFAGTARNGRPNICAKRSTPTTNSPVAQRRRISQVLWFETLESDPEAGGA